MSVWQQQNNVYLAGAIVLAILIVLALARASMPKQITPVLPTPTEVPTTIPTPTFSPTETPSATPYFIKHTNSATVSGKIAS